MTKREAKEQACLATALQLEALLMSDYLLSWTNDDGQRTSDGRKIESAIEEIRDLMWRKAGDTADRYHDEIKADLAAIQRTER
jgi:hypothetical protein